MNHPTSNSTNPATTRWRLTDASGALTGILFVLAASLAFQSWISPTNDDQNAVRLGDQRLGLQISLNAAQSAELMVLPTIGPRLASRLIQHRDSHGPFQNWDDVLAVHGIGPATIAAIEPWVTLDRSLESVAKQAARFDGHRVASSK